MYALYGVELYSLSFLRGTSVTQFSEGTSLKGTSLTQFSEEVGSLSYLRRSFLSQPEGRRSFVGTVSSHISILSALFIIGYSGNYA